MRTRIKIKDLNDRQWSWLQDNLKAFSRMATSDGVVVRVDLITEDKQAIASMKMTVRRFVMMVSTLSLMNGPDPDVTDKEIQEVMDRHCEVEGEGV